MKLVQMRLVQMIFGTDEIGTDELWLIQGLVKMRYAGVEVAPLFCEKSIGFLAPQCKSRVNQILKNLINFLDIPAF